MKVFIIVAFFYLIPTKSRSQPIKDTTNASIVLKLSFYPVIGETVVYGKIIMTKDSLFFNAVPCKEKWKKWSSIIPCNAHLIKPIGVSFQEIKKMKRRAYFFLIPNRLFIQTKTNDTYLFITYKRRAIIRKYQSYLETLNGAGQENRVGKVQ